MLRIALATASTVALVVPAHALADYYVPPENSAANQYTESFPGAGGEKGGKGKKATPADTLGARNAERLEERGPAGKAAAELAAETAPSQVTTTVAEAAGNGGDNNGGTGNAGGAGKGTGGSGSGGSAGANGGSTSSGGGTNVVDNAVKVDQPQGSSGVGHVLGQATGVGDGNVGIWLPLVILLTLAGSIAYAARSRQLRHGHSA